MVLTGRGGFGNYVAREKYIRELQQTPAQPAPSPLKNPRVGRGGLGNIRQAEWIASEIKAKPLEQQQRIEQSMNEQVRQREGSVPRSFMIGRGGSGNFVGRRDGPPLHGLRPTASAPVQSAPSKLWSKLRPSKTH